MLHVSPQGAETLPPTPLAQCPPARPELTLFFAFQPVLHRSCPCSQSAPWRRGHRGPRAGGRRQVAVCWDRGSYQSHGCQALCEGSNHILSGSWEQRVAWGPTLLRLERQCLQPGTVPSAVGTESLRHRLTTFWVCTWTWRMSVWARVRNRTSQCPGDDHVTLRTSVCAKAGCLHEQLVSGVRVPPHEQQPADPWSVGRDGAGPGFCVGPG